jgi:hypothetical protein
MKAYINEAKINTSAAKHQKKKSVISEEQKCGRRHMKNE